MNWRKILTVFLWTAWSFGLGFMGGWTIAGWSDDMLIHDATMAIRRCTDSLNDASSTIAWAMYEIDRLTGKRPGNPKKPPARPEPWHPL
jgi:hypothetical protein